MSFITLILKNLLRQRIRTGLAILGISIGIMTIVTLGAITGGLKGSMEGVLSTGDADFMVAQRGTSDFTFSTITRQEWDAIAAVPDIEWSQGMLVHISRIKDNPFFFTVGVEPEQLDQSSPTLLEGRLLGSEAPGEIMIGRQASSDLDASIGDQVTVDSRSFRVVGIYETGTVWLDSGAYANLESVQQMARKPDVVSVVYVKAREGVDPSLVARTIEEQVPTVVPILSVADVGQIDQGFELLDAANLAISLLAVGIGAIGVMNTMIMSVFERTREIGVLRAVGWRGQRILKMIIGEALLLCVVAAVIGILLGFLVAQAIMLIEAVSGFLELEFSLDIFIRALAVAVIVALTGAAYPAFRATRLTPMEALRHE